MQKSKELSEDQEADGHDEVQKITDDHIKKIDDLLAEKEKEVLEVWHTKCDLKYIKTGFIKGWFFYAG